MSKKVEDILNKVTENYNKALMQEDLRKLLERKSLLEEKMSDSSIQGTARANNRIQLRDVNKTIDILSQEVNLSDKYDTEVDEVYARSFLEDMGDDFDGGSIIESNDILDELERTLGLKGD